jgi:hypothetical protein
MDVIERFLDRMVAHDWPGVAACVSADVERIGPYRDAYRGRDEYVGFLAGLLPGLPGYRMAVSRIAYAGPSLGLAELSETVDGEGGPVDTPEALVFDLDEDGLIARVAVYTQA